MKNRTMRQMRNYGIAYLLLTIWFNCEVFATPKTTGLSRPVTTKEHNVNTVREDTERWFSWSWPWPSPSASSEFDPTEFWPSLLDFMLSNYGSSTPPTPSPSESPIPIGIGEGPLYVGFQNSIEGVNEESYTQFRLNKKFYHEKEEEPSSAVYDENRDVLHNLMKRAEQGSLNMEKRKRWQKVANAIIKSYRKERGAVFYDIVRSLRWTYCGWVNMTKTFIDTDKNMRLCVSLISLGMDDIIRPPEEGEDFIIPGKTDPEDIEELVLPVLTPEQRELIQRRVRLEQFEESEYVTVNILGYPNECESPEYMDANCYSFCCLSPYYGSDFCNECKY